MYGGRKQSSPGNFVPRSTISSRRTDVICPVYKAVIIPRFELLCTTGIPVNIGRSDLFRAGTTANKAIDGGASKGEIKIQNNFD